MRRRNRDLGLTLVELLVCLLVAAVIQNMAMPEFHSFINSTRVSSATNSIFTGLMLTRSEAIKRNSRVVMCKSNDGLGCSKVDTWKQGWIIFHDVNNDAEVSVGETLIERQNEYSEAINVFGNGPVSSYVSYTPLGQTAFVSGAFQAGKITICSISGSSPVARQVIISSSGRPRVMSNVNTQC